MFDSHSGDVHRLCKLYCDLAHSGRSDAAGELRSKVDKMLQRSDTLSQHIRGEVQQSVLRWSAGVELDDLMESLTLWLNDIKLQLTQLQHYSDDMNVDSRLACLHVSVMTLLRIYFDSADNHTLGL